MADEEDKIRPQISYVDGTFAFIKDTISNITVKVNDVTKTYHDFILTPTPRTIKAWNLKQKKEQDFVEEGKYSGYYRKRYETILCQQIDYSPKPVWILHCNWNGTPIDIFKGQLELWRNLISSKDTIIQSITNELKSLRFRMRRKSKNFMIDMQKDADDLRKVADKVGGPTIINSDTQQDGESPTR